MLDQGALAAIVAACGLWRMGWLPVPGYGHQVVETMVFEGLMAVVIGQRVARVEGLRLSMACVASFLAATVIDLDHILVAGSFDFIKVMNTNTPVTHSLVFACVAGLLAWLATGRAAWGWILFSGVAVHVFWDSTDAPQPPLPLWWPFSWYQMPRALGYVAVECLFLVSYGWSLIPCRQNP